MVVIHKLSDFWYIDVDDFLKRYDTNQVSIAKTQARILFSGPDWRIEPLAKILEMVVSSKPGDNRLYDRWKKRSLNKKETTVSTEKDDDTTNITHEMVVNMMRFSSNLLYKQLERHTDHIAKLQVNQHGEIELFCVTCEREGRTNMDGKYVIYVFDYKDIV